MRNDKKTRMVKISKAVAAPATLAAVAALAFVGMANLCPNCKSRPVDDPVVSEKAVSQDGTVDREKAANRELIANLNVDNFSANIEEGITLVDFWAPWCGPCRMQGPILEEVARTIGDRAKIAKVNVDQAAAVAGRFGVQSIPTLVLFKDGNEVRRLVGVQSKETLVEAIEKLLSGGNNV